MMGVNSRIWILHSLVWTSLVSHVIAGEMKEYCERTSFSARCNQDEVILMTSAMYGRMRLGRCVRTDYGSIGCKTDVLSIVHSFCSGKRECEFPISKLHSKTPCPTELISYLEASYECIPVSPCSPSLCKAGSYLRVPTVESAGYIGGITTSETGCGSPECPWVLEPKEGQRFNFTFYFFPNIEDLANQGHCHRHATILDKETKVSKDITVCNGGPMVTSHVTSESSQVEIKVFSGRTESPSQILIHYKVVGCPSIKAPSGATVERHGDTLSVVCGESTKSWHLTCNGNAWVGEIGLCDNAPWSLPIEEGTTPEGLAMVVGIGVALGVFLGFSLLGLAVFCMRRHRNNQYQRPDEFACYPPTSDKAYDVKIYNQSGRDTKITATPDSGYYAGTNYQTQQIPVGAGHPRQLTSPRILHPAPQGNSPPSYFQSVGPAEPPYKFRDHVYESPNFKQQGDEISVTTPPN